MNFSYFVIRKSITFCVVTSYAVISKMTLVNLRYRYLNHSIIVYNDIWFVFGSSWYEKHYVNVKKKKCPLIYVQNREDFSEGLSTVTLGTFFSNKSENGLLKITCVCVRMCVPLQDFENNNELKTKAIVFLDEVMHDPELLTQERKAAANIIRWTAVWMIPMYYVNQAFEIIDHTVNTSELDSLSRLSGL